VNLQPPGEEGLQGLTGEGTRRSFFTLRIELADDLGTGPTADIDALGPAIWELDEQRAAESSVRGVVDGTLAGGSSWLGSLAHGPSSRSGGHLKASGVLQRAFAPFGVYTREDAAKLPSAG
jgi:hypothetical protein